MDVTPLTKIAKGAFFVLGGLLFSKTLGLFWRILVARIGVIEYGSLSLAWVVFDTLVGLAVMGLPVGVIRFVAFYRRKERPGKVKEVILSGAKIILSFALVAALILFFAAPLVARFLHNSELTFFLRIFAFALPFAALIQVFLAVFYGFQNIEYAVLSTTVVEALTRVLITAVLIALGFGIFGALGGYVIAVLVVFVLSFHLSQKIFPIFNLRAKLSRELISFSWPVALSNLFATPLRYLEVIFLGFFKSAFMVGIYQAASPLAGLLQIVPSAFLQLFLPVITDLYAQERAIDKTYKIVTRWIFLVNFPLSLLLFAFAPDFITTLFGRNYLEAVLPLRILVFGYLLLTLVIIPGRKVLDMLKRTDLNLVLTIILLIVEVGLGFFLIPRFGVSGAAMMVTFGFLAEALVCAFFLFYFAQISIFDSAWVKPFLAGSISLGIAKLIPSFFFGFLAFGVIYPFMLIFLGGVTKTDRKVIRLMFSQMRER